MKTAFLKFLPIIAAVMLATSCSKDDNDNAPTNGRDGVHTVSTSTIPFSIRVNTGRSLKKMAYENGTEVGSYQPKFEQKDEGNLTMIIKDGDDVIGNLTLDDAKTATFRAISPSSPRQMPPLPPKSAYQAAKTHPTSRLQPFSPPVPTHSAAHLHTVRQKLTSPTRLHILPSHYLPTKPRLT